MHSQYMQWMWCKDHTGITRQKVSAQQMENTRTSVQVVVLMLEGILFTLERRSLGHDLLLTCVYPRAARVLSLTLLGAVNVSGDVSQCDWLHCCQLSWSGQEPVYFGRLLAVLQGAFCHVSGLTRSDSWSHQCPEMRSSWTIPFRSQEWTVNCQFLSCMSLLAEHACSGTLML